MLLAIALQVSLLANAHSHNDYEHAGPLLDALEQGFCSVEADVFLEEGELRVGHDRKDLRPGRTLEKFYLDPLFARWKRFKGVYPNSPGFTLLVDIKADGKGVWNALIKRLEDYRPMLSSFENGRTVLGAVTVILSGDRPVKDVAGLKNRLAFIDGRLPDLDSDPDVGLVPLVSASYAETFATASADLTLENRSRLKEIVERAHVQGRRVRFWAAPDNPGGWRLLKEAGVDLINTDRLKGLRKFLSGGK